MKTLENIEPINLVSKYQANNKYSEIKETFANWLIKNNKQINLVNIELNLKVGNIVEFKNGFEIPMITEILGFDIETNKAYLVWDCYWFGVNLMEREYKLVS